MIIDPVYRIWVPGEYGYKEHVDRIGCFANVIETIKNESERHIAALKRDELLSQEIGLKTIATNEQMIRAIQDGLEEVLQVTSDGFKRLDSTNRKGFQDVVSVIEALHHSFVYFNSLIIQKLDRQNDILTGVIKLLQSPFENKVREYYNRGCMLMEGGIFSEAIECFKYSIEKLELGKHFFLSYYQLGRIYLTGFGSDANITDPKEATKYLLEANKYGSAILRAQDPSFLTKHIDYYDDELIDLVRSGSLLYATSYYSRVNNCSLSKAKEEISKIKLSLEEQECSNPFQMILADSNLYLSQSYYYQLDNAYSMTDFELISKAIRYAKEAITLNKDLSQGYYHLAKYYSYRSKFKNSHTITEDINELKINFSKAVQLDRNYLRSVIERDPLFDQIFNHNIPVIFDVIDDLKVKKGKQAKHRLQEIKLTISFLKDNNIYGSLQISKDIEDIESFLSDSLLDLNTDTYFGYDDFLNKMKQI